MARIWTGVLLALGAAACGESPAEPVRGQYLAPSAEVSAYIPSLQDAIERILPTLDDRAGSQRIRDSMQRFWNELVARRAVKAMESLSLSEQAVAAYRGDSPHLRIEEGPELSVLDVVLTRGARLLGITR